MAEDGKKTFAQFEEELGEEIANRAEVLAAMDCLMHHLRNEDQLEQWTMVAVKDERNWNILDWDPDESAERTKNYMELAKSMDRRSFECIVHTFACIVKSECFGQFHIEGAFSYRSAPTDLR